MVITVISAWKLQYITLKQVLKYIGQFLSDFIVEKICLIPPLLHSDALISDFKQKADSFNNLFISQYVCKQKYSSRYSVIQN